MRWFTHVACAVFLELLVPKYFGTPTWDGTLPTVFVLLGLCFAVFGSLLPDIDHPKSKLGKYVPIIGWLFAKHRGYCHSLWMGVLAGGLFYWLGLPLFCIIAFQIGFLSHLGLDMVTRGGISPLYPVPFVVRGPFVTGGVMDWILFVVFVAGSLVVGLWL